MPLHLIKNASLVKKYSPAEISAEENGLFEAITQSESEKILIDLYSLSAEDYAAVIGEVTRASVEGEKTVFVVPSAFFKENIEGREELDTYLSGKLEPRPTPSINLTPRKPSLIERIRLLLEEKRTKNTDNRHKPKGSGGGAEYCDEDFLDDCWYEPSQAGEKAEREAVNGSRMLCVKVCDDFGETEEYLDYLSDAASTVNEIDTDRQQIELIPQKEVTREEIKDKLSSPDELDQLLRRLDAPFSRTVMHLIDCSGMTDSDCYKRANVSRQTWHKIVNDKNYRPSRTTVISFAIALELSANDTQRLLATVGYTLSRSSKFDIVVMYCIENRIYDIIAVNELLYSYDLPTLGTIE